MLFFNLSLQDTGKKGDSNLSQGNHKPVFLHNIDNIQSTKRSNNTWKQEWLKARTEQRVNYQKQPYYRGVIR